MEIAMEIDAGHIVSLRVCNTILANYGLRDCFDAVKGLPCDVILCHSCSGNHDCSWILNLHFPQQHISVLSELYIYKAQSVNMQPGCP